MLFLAFIPRHSTQTLTILDLRYNNLGDEGAQHLADALRNNAVSIMLPSDRLCSHLDILSQILTTLKLDCNQIGSVGIQHLVDALQNNTITSIASDT